MTNSALAVVLALILDMAGTADAQPVRSGVAAMVGDTPVSASELEELSQGRLLRLRAEEYSVRQDVLEEMISRLLIEREARARGISAEALFQVEVEGKVPPLTAAESRAAWDIIMERSAGAAKSQTPAQVEASLRQKRLDDRREEFVKSLREKAGVRVLLDPPRVRIDNGDAPVKGPQHAPVTIVEFSDFQCPYCSRASATLKQLQAQYGDQLRIVFRHFPLPAHTEAPKASEAALCAGEQKRFWEMHDRLFASPNRLRTADLEQHAADLGLDKEHFLRCLESGKFAERVQADAADGSRYGVTATPAFFINGRPLTGAAPYESFTRLIDDELSRVSSELRPLGSLCTSCARSADRVALQDRGREEEAMRCHR